MLKKDTVGAPGPSLFGRGLAVAVYSARAVAAGVVARLQ